MDLLLLYRKFYFSRLHVFHIFTLNRQKIQIALQAYHAESAFGEKNFWNIFLAYHPFFIENSLHFHAYTKSEMQSLFYISPLQSSSFSIPFLHVSRQLASKKLCYLSLTKPRFSPFFASRIIEELAGTLSTSLLFMLPAPFADVTCLTLYNRLFAISCSLTNMPAQFSRAQRPSLFLLCLPILLATIAVFPSTNI